MVKSKVDITKGVYIRSLQASSIWEDNHREFRPLINMDEDDFDGKISYSLELIKLNQIGLHVKKKNENRNISYDIINVKFGRNVPSGKEILSNIDKWINDKAKSIEDMNKKLKEKLKIKIEKNLKNTISKLEQEIIDLNKLKQILEKNEEINEEVERLSKEVINNPLAKKEINELNKKRNKVWDEKKLNDLRKELYTNGFDLNICGKQVHFCFYKRSSAKSRNGECWFIRKDLYEEMDKWSQLRLDFDKENLDLAGLMAYESLVTSSIIKTITIDPNSILLIDKVVSKFKDKVNVINLNEKGLLDCIKNDEFPMENEIFDGEALLDSSFFKNELRNKGFLQLRGSYFKCAAFNTNLQKFFKDEYGDEYETATVKDMFNNTIYVKDIKMVINPSCLKCLKMSYAIGSTKDMWEYWKKFTANENKNQFGVCKYEKETKRVDEDERKQGIHFQQMSYQMINSLPADHTNIKKLAQFEIEYIEKLKNNNERFMKYLDRTKNKMNANEMFMDIYNKNPNIAKTKIFRNYKKEIIRKYKEDLQSGKIRIPGDYCTIAGNLVEYLMAALGKVEGELNEPLALRGNEIFTTLLPEGNAVGFRNPHVSPANILRVKNKRIDLINKEELNKKENEYLRYFKYFNLTQNIVVVNAIGFSINDILNGSDYDGDTLLLSDLDELLTISKDIKNRYPVPVNKIPLKKDSLDVKYRLNNESKAKVDNKLSLSQKRIGKITNAGQLACSLMWHNKKMGNYKEYIELLKIVNSLAVCSGLAIDGAKREYDLDLDAQITYFNKKLNDKLLTYKGKIKNKRTGEIREKNFKYKPKFWRYVRDKKKQNITKDSFDNEKKVNFETKDSKEIREKLYYKTPMDLLILTLNKKIKRAEGIDESKQLVEILDEGKIRDGDRRKQKEFEELALKSQQETNKAYSDMIYKQQEIEFKKVERIMEKYDRKISSIKMDRKTMYALIAKISKRTEGEITNKMDNGKPYPNLRIMLHLYNNYKEMFLNTFIKE